VTASGLFRLTTLSADAGTPTQKQKEHVHVHVVTRHSAFPTAPNSPVSPKKIFASFFIIYVCQIGNLNCVCAAFFLSFLQGI